MSTEYKYAQIFIIIIIASQTQMVTSYFGAECRGRKVIKRKVSTGNHYYLFGWVCCVERKVCRRRADDFLL